MKSARAVVDATGWLEFFTDGPDAAFFAQTLQDTDNLIVPTVTICEVFQYVYRNSGESQALQAAAAMGQGTVVDLDTSAALDAGRLAVEHGLSYVAAAALAVARAHDAQLWTLDDELRSIEGVRYRTRTGSAIRRDGGSRPSASAPPPSGTGPA